MGFFNKILGGSKKEIESKGLAELIELEINDGETMLPFKFWNHASVSTFHKDGNSLILNGDNQYDASSVALVIDDFHKVFGLDSGGDGECTNEVVQDLSDFGMINRSWHFDENFNSKSSEWVLDESNNHDFAIAVDITFDNEEGLQISFSEWSKMKKHIQSKL